MLNDAKDFLESGNRFMITHEEALYDSDNGLVEDNFLNAYEKYVQILIQKDNIQDAAIVEKATEGMNSTKEKLISIRDGLIETANAITDNEYAKPFQDRANNISTKLEL